MVSCCVHSGLRGPLVGVPSEDSKGGETLPGAAYIEVYRCRQALPPRRKEGGLLGRILEAVGIAGRTTRSS